ncbi:MAG TPA: efflux transporter outer membrane subunit [Acidobacteriota bacterium]|nr:efflux transporter outer membrane subunit [Acidobacteriota bacterium]
MHRFIPLIAVLVLTSACPRRTQYSRPALPVPAAWPENAAGPAAAPGTPAAAEMKWQEFFTDQRLQSVIELALANNRDLRAAALNIERVQTLYRIQLAELYPTIAATAGGNAYRVPKNLSGKDHAETVAQYTVGLGTAAWELDLFGRIRSLKSSVLEQYLATEQARSATQISLVAAVAGTYLALAADRENLRLAQVTLDAQQSSYELIRRSSQVGIASDLDLREAQTQVDAARVDIARYSGQAALDEHALNLLVGAPVPPALLPDSLAKVGTLKDVAAGLPSDVLLRRPDILSAEHQLKAASANIGVARAAFFPRISLTAAAGITSSDLTNLFKPAAGTWNFAPQAALPIFDYGTRQAGFKAAEVDRDTAIATYEKAIQAAFSEVSDALSLRTTLVDQQNALQSLVGSLEETYRLSEARYKGGIDSYLSVLVAQRALYAAQQQLVGVRLARLGNLVTLYKVLGGGA